MPGIIAYFCHDNGSVDRAFEEVDRERTLEFAVALGSHAELQSAPVSSIHILSCPSQHARGCAQTLIDLLEPKQPRFLDELWSYGSDSERNFEAAHRFILRHAEESSVLIVVTGWAMAACLSHLYFHDVLKQRVVRYPLDPFEARVILPDQRRSICVNGRDAHIKDKAHAPMY